MANLDVLELSAVNYIAQAFDVLELSAETYTGQTFDILELSATAEVVVGTRFDVIDLSATATVKAYMVRRSGEWAATDTLRRRSGVWQ